MTEWMIRIAYPVMRVVNIALFTSLVPRGSKLSPAEKAIYRGLVKLVVVEHRMQTRLQGRFSAC
ncbi:MAG: hypothetical protein KBA61_01900 [Spirochaetes bacterium]|nr:hypothetical protein [Spirochaetota bacterium]